MTESKVNVPLLYQVLGHIAAHPESWRQNDWITIINNSTGLPKSVWDNSAQTDCSTAGCFAGWVAALSPEIEFIGPKPGEPIKGDYRYSQQVRLNGKEMHVSEAAELVLGLTSLEANALFNSGNDTLGSLAQQVRRIVQRAQTPPVPKHRIELPIVQLPWNKLDELTDEINESLTLRNLPASTVTKIEEDS